MNAKTALYMRTFSMKVAPIAMSAYRVANDNFFVLVFDWLPLYAVASGYKHER